MRYGTAVDRYGCGPVRQVHDNWINCSLENKILLARDRDCNWKGIVMRGIGI